MSQQKQQEQLRAQEAAAWRAQQQQGMLNWQAAADSSFMGMDRNAFSPRLAPSLPVRSWLRTLWVWLKGGPL